MYRVFAVHLRSSRARRDEAADAEGTASVYQASGHLLGVVVTESRAGKRKKKDKPERRAYSRHSVAVWFRVFRTMTRDAMGVLDLQRDPTLRVSLPEASPEPEESNSLTPEQLAAFLDAMREKCPQHYALVVLLAYTCLRFCHASALRWEDWDEATGVIRLVRKQVRGKTGPVSRKKRAPKQFPVEPELAEVLRAHGKRMLITQAPGLEGGWMFPSSTGGLRTPSSLDKAWGRCLELAKIDKRFTVHGLRYTFTDLVRRANVDAVVRRALTGHVTEEMQRRYSTVGLDEKRAAVAGVIRLVPPESAGSASAAVVEVGSEWDQTRSKWDRMRFHCAWSHPIPPLRRQKWDQRWDQATESSNGR